MDETTGMDIRHGARCLKGAIDGFSHRKRPTFSNQSGKIGPVHEFHGQKVAEDPLVEFIDGHNSGMAATGAGFSLPLESQDVVRRTYEFLFKDLKCHFTF